MSRERTPFPSPGFRAVKPKRRILSGVCLSAAILLAGYARVNWVRTHASSPALVARLGAALPPLVVTDASGGLVDVGKAFLGGKSIIVFYSASCYVCQAVLPELRPFPGSLRLVLVNEETGKPSRAPEGFESALQFRDSNHVLSRSFPMSGVPTILFVDEQGVLRDGLVGEHARGLLQRKLKEFAREQP